MLVRNALHLEAFRVYTVQPSGMPVRQCYMPATGFRVSVSIWVRTSEVAYPGNSSCFAVYVG